MRKKLSLFLTSLFFLALIALAGCSRFAGAGQDKSFQAYTRNLFCQEVSANSISLHYTLENPAAYGITDAPITFGGFPLDTDMVCASLENALAVLHSYDPERLTSKNQLTYDVLEASLTSSLALARYPLYEEPLSPLTGTQSQLPVLLSEYQFADTSDVDTYLELLTRVPEYFGSIIAFEQAKSDAGLFMAPYTAADILKECRTFIQLGEKNYLYSSFEERLSGLQLSEASYNTYAALNRERLEESVFPAYQQLMDALAGLQDTGSNYNGLCHLPEGRAYYECLVASETGSSRTVEELKTLTRRQMTEDLGAMQQVLNRTAPANSASVLEAPDPVGILTDLKTQIDDLFPAPPEVNTQIKYVQKSMEEYLSPAFYMVPAIDNSGENVIYINQGHLPDDMSLYTTLAHEGYPGHLYQTVYYQSQNPDPIRSLLNFGGYTEGWATYSEMISYYFAPVSKDAATLLQHNTSVILGLYSLADIGIHYEGWTLLDTVSFFHQYGITDTNTIENIYDLIIADPANYLKYYIGYVEFLELKKDAMDSWGDEFTQKRFHTAVLKTGPASFDLLRKYIMD